MRVFLGVTLLTLAMGCTAKTEIPTVPEPIRTHPAPYPKKKRMICNENEAPAVVAVIDTGLMDNTITKKAKLCKFGHKDFSNLNHLQVFKNVEAGVPSDNHGHGTNVAGLIQKYAENANFCIVVIKYVDPMFMNNNNGLDSTIKAFEYATNIKAKYVNYSGGGTEPSYEEKKAVLRYLATGGTLIAAAGNERADVNKKPYYPAMYDSRIMTVGSIEHDGRVAYYSNFGNRVKNWEEGTNKLGFGVVMSGTSQATAVFTGKLIKQQECYK